jgi:hypothetical protein
MMVRVGRGGFVAGAARTTDERGVRDVEGWRATSQKKLGLDWNPRAG